MRMTSYGYARTFGYDAARNQTLSIDRGGKARSFTYDNLDRTTSESQDGYGVANKRVEFAYDNGGSPTSLTRYDTSGSPLVTTTYGYDAAGRQTLIQNLLPAGTTSYSYAYDADDRRTLMTQAATWGSYTASYAYDHAGQLTGVTYPELAINAAYTYDANGNRTSAADANIIGGTAPYTVGADNRVTGDGIYSYTFDHEGHRLTRTQGTTVDVYSWDDRGRLTGIVTSVGGTLARTINYGYDASDRRVSERILDGSGNETFSERYTFDGNDLVGVYDGSGNLYQRYLHGPQVDQVLAEETPANGSDAMRWLLGDDQGSIREMVDNGAAVTLGLVYDEYGNVIGGAGSGVYRFAFTGKQYDAAAELLHYARRDYDPFTGQFISQDPSGLGPDADPYRYVGNDPVDLVDPTGLSATKNWLGIDTSPFSPTIQSQSLGDFIASSYQNNALTWGAAASGPSAAQGVRGQVAGSPAPVMASSSPAAGGFGAALLTASQLGLAALSSVNAIGQVNAVTLNAGKQVGTALATDVIDYGLNTLGGLFETNGAPASSIPFTGTIPGTVGRTTGHVLGMMQGLNEVSFGLGGEVIGGGLDATVLGVPAGVIVAGASTAVILHGGAVAINGARLGVVTVGSGSATGALFQTTSGASGSGTGGSGPAPGAGSSASSGGSGGTGSQAATNAAVRPVVESSLPQRVTNALEEGGIRTPEETAQARNFFERNREAAEQWWSDRNGGNAWPENATHAEHPIPLKNGGDPLYIEPGFGGPNAPHMIPGSDGLTDFERWGQLGGRPPKR